MASDATITTVTDGILAWCGVDDPTSAEMSAAEMAAQSAIDTIQHYRGLTDDDDLETKYMSMATEMGIYAFQKRGVDGAVNLSEGGVQRTYESGSFPPSMLARITLPVTVG